MDDLLNSFADHSITNNLVNDPTNNDITDNLSNNITDQTIQSPTEEGYIYHFVNGSPAGSGHERLICADSDIPASTLTQTQVPLTNGAIKSHTDFEEIDPVTTASAGKDDTFFDIEKESHQSIGDENTDEADYNTDIDENDDDLAVNNDRQNDLDGFAQHLRRLRRQDMERDELLTVRLLSSVLMKSADSKRPTATLSRKSGLEEGAKGECPGRQPKGGSC